MHYGRKGILILFLGCALLFAGCGSKNAQQQIVEGPKQIFQEEREYGMTDQEINQIIREQIAFSDIELIRRELFDYAYLNRERDGSRYWKNERE